MTEDHKFFYANALEVAMSGYDFSFKFMRQGPPVANAPGAIPGGAFSPKLVTPVTIDSLVIGMSPSHAKAVMMALVENIKTYEENFGPIPMPSKEKKP